MNAETLMERVTLMAVEAANLAEQYADLLREVLDIPSPSDAPCAFCDSAEQHENCLRVRIVAALADISQEMDMPGD